MRGSIRASHRHSQTKKVSSASALRRFRSYSRLSKPTSVTVACYLPVYALTRICSVECIMGMEWINQHQRKGRRGEEDDRSRAVHTGACQRGAGTKGRREVDAYSRQRTAPLAGKSLAGDNRPGASAR